MTTTPAVHPGAILRAQFMEPQGLSASGLAIRLHVPAPRVNDIVRERRSVTADTALRLSRYFGLSDEFWIGLQADIRVAGRGRGIIGAKAGERPAKGGFVKARGGGDIVDAQFDIVETGLHAADQ